MVALVVLIIFLLSAVLGEAEKRKEADKARDALIRKIDQDNQNIAQLIAIYLQKVDEAAAKAKAAGQTPSITREEFLQSLRQAIPQEVIQEAVKIAEQKQNPGPRGPPGPQGPEGPPGTSSNAATSTTTTTRQRPPSSTSTTSSTTTTTRPCTVGALGLCIRIGPNGRP